MPVRNGGGARKKGRAKPRTATEDTPVKIGFIGLGNMGMHMARNLRAAGHELVVHNRSRGKVETFVAEGGTPARSPAEVASQAEIVMACLPFPQTCEEVFLGPDGVTEGATEGQLWIDFSTNGPDTARRLAEGAASKGAGFLDAPISGGPAGAEAGTLAIMVGGGEADFARAEPVLQVVGANVRHFGPVGAGSVVKLVNQLVSATTSAAIAEGYVMAVKNGVDPRALYETLRTAIADSRMHERLVPDKILARDFAPLFAVDLLAKDLGLASQLSRQSGVRALVTNLSDQLFQEAQARGYGQSDIAAIIRPLEDLVGVEVKPA